MKVLHMRGFINRFINRLGYKIEKLPTRPGRIRQEKYFYQQKYVDFNIQLGDKVIDIGSGGQPFPLATHLCDLRLETSSDRPIDTIVIDDRQFFLADILNIPCKNKQFNFAYCCHVLEHVKNPIASCKEIQRIAKRGYIETPTLCKDILFGWARGMHSWHVINHGSTLVFFEYTERLLEGCRSSYWKKSISQTLYHPLQDIFYDNQDIFNTMFSWRDMFRVEVFRNNCRKPEIYDPFVTQSVFD